MQARPGHLWSAQATPAAMLYLPVPPRAAGPRISLTAPALVCPS